MAHITIEFKGGPFDGPNDVKDTGAPIVVWIPLNGVLHEYRQDKDGEPAYYKGKAALAAREGA